MRILARLSKMALRYRWRIAAAYFFVIGATILYLAIPRIIGISIDRLIKHVSFRELIFFAGLILVVSVIRGIFSFYQSYLSEWISQRVAYDLRNSFFDKLQRLSFAYHDTQQTGDLMSKATADVDAVRWFVQMCLLRSAQLFLLIIGAAVLILLMDWRLGLITLAFVPLISFRAVKMALSLRVTWLKVQRITGEMITVLQENLMGVRVVRAYGAEEFENGKFQKKAAQVAEYTIQSSKLQASNASQMALAFALATGVILWYGGNQVINGKMTAGDLTQFILYMGLLAMPIRMMGWIISTFSRAASSGQRIYEVLDAQSPVKEAKNPIELARANGKVTFHNVSFTYDSQSPVIKEVSFEASPGQVIAFLGAPGSGKSTIVNLIPRFYDVTQGKVTIDGNNIRDINLTSLRSNIGIVLQEVFLFSDTIRENIAYGQPDAKEGEIVRAANVAQLHEFITSLPEGYGTWVGERGITLSGGQRQRLAIARTLLLDPPILILDDSTSSVDAHTEHLLRKALTEVMRGRTTFVIAHRLSTVRNADLILVLKEGQIVERGTHAELLKAGGLYREIYELQLLPQEEKLLERTPAGGSG